MLRTYEQQTVTRTERQAPCLNREHGKTVKAQNIIEASAIFYARFDEREAVCEAEKLSFETIEDREGRATGQSH